MFLSGSMPIQAAEPAPKSHPELPSETPATFVPVTNRCRRTPGGPSDRGSVGPG